MADILTILKKVGAVITDDHLVLTSGLHTEVYVNKDALYPHPLETSQVGELFAKKLVGKGIETVVGPALGGIILSQWIAYHLSKLEKREIAGVYTEKGPDNSMIFTRGYDKYVRGKKVVAIEDTVSTGGSVKKVVDAIRDVDGNVVVVAVMVNRNPEVNSEFFETEFVALGELFVNAYEEKNCPLCKKKMPINLNIGHGRKYLEAKGLLK